MAFELLLRIHSGQTFSTNAVANAQLAVSTVDALIAELDKDHPRNQ